MSSLLVARYVDDGKLDWDQKVIDAYPDFRAPTDELTRSLRVRDLMGMATGIGEPATSGLHQGDPTATQLLQSIVNLPVIARPGEEFFYNNTVYAVAGYLPAMRDGPSGAGLTAAYHELMRTRVFGHAGMTGARLADDPRGIVTDHSRGHGPQLSGNLSTMPYGPVGSYWPVGGTLATLDDMAAYVRLHLRDGVSVDGRRVVSAANLAERYKPQISIPLSPELDPDAVSAGYGMGLIHQRYRDGSSLIWHNGGIDGFTSYVGFLPQHDLGLVVLNSINPEPTRVLLLLVRVELRAERAQALITGCRPKCTMPTRALSAICARSDTGPGAWITALSRTGWATPRVATGSCSTAEGYRSGLVPILPAHQPRWPLRHLRWSAPREPGQARP